MRVQRLPAAEVCKHIRAMNATRKGIAGRLGITSPQVSELKRGKLDRFSCDRLMALLAALGYDLELRET